MAYFIDEAGKRGLMADGKQFFAWSRETRKFSVPVDDAPPKSRMLRSSEYDAKFFNYKSDPADCPFAQTGTGPKLCEECEKKNG